MRNNKETYLCGDGDRQALGNGTDKPWVPEAVPCGLGGGCGTGGQKRARMLVLGTGDGGGGQRTVRTQNRAQMRSILGLGGGGGTGGQKRARMLVSGSGNGGGASVLDFGVGWRWQHRRAETSTNAHFGVGGRWQRPENNQNPEIKHIRAQFQGWEVAATGEGQSEPQNEHKFSFQGWWQEEGRQNLENKQSCLLSGWEDGGGSQRMSKSRKRACPARFWGWGLINDV